MASKSEVSNGLLKLLMLYNTFWMMFSKKIRNRKRSNYLSNVYLRSCSQLDKMLIFKSRSRRSLKKFPVSGINMLKLLEVWIKSIAPVLGRHCGPPGQRDPTLKLVIVEISSKLSWTLGPNRSTGFEVKVEVDLLSRCPSRFYFYWLRHPVLNDKSCRYNNVFWLITWWYLK